MPKRKMSLQRKAFCKQYLIDLNATQAAIRAGYSRKTSYSIGQRLLKSVEVQAEVQRVMTEREKRTEINADYVLSGIKNIAENCAEQVESESGVQVRNPQSALKAFELLGKHLVLFSERVQHGVDQSLAEAIQEAAENMSLDPVNLVEQQKQAP